MFGRLQSTLALVVASGTLVASVLAFTGALWPYAPSDVARAHLAFANAASVGALIGVALCLLGAIIVSAARPERSRLDILSPILAGAIFLLGFVFVVVHISAAMNTWFSEPPTMDPATILAFRLMVIGGLGLVFMALAVLATVWIRDGLRRIRH